jgi:hypothetical protein
MSQAPEHPEPSVASLLPGAMVGLLAAARRSTARAISASADRLPLTRAAVRYAFERGPLKGLRSSLEEWSLAGSQELGRMQALAEDLADELVPALARAILQRVDLNEAISRIDVERVVSKVDLVALARNVLDGLDLAGIARGVIDELDLTELIRESTGTVTVEAVDALRLGGMSADRMVSRVVDRLLMRKGERAPNGAVATSSAGDGHR